MLVTLRLRFADRPDLDLAVERPESGGDPRELLASLVGNDGRIALGDRDSCRLEDVADVTIVEPVPREGPGWERGLQDEDVATALDENYDA